jgi:excisionase family DNA binding protein
LKTLLEDHDIQQITEKILESLRPFLNKQKQSSSEDRMFDVKDLSDYLRVSRSWIYQRTRLNEIPHFKIDGQVLFKKSKINEWIENYHIEGIKIK